MENKNFKKNFIWNILGTGLNAFNSLFYMIVVTRINGLDDAGIFTIAFATACIIYFLGVYAGRIYQVTENDKSINDKEYIANRLITTVLMLIIVIIFVLFKRYSMFKCTVFILLTLYKALEAFSDVIYGILQKNEKLEIVGKSLFYKSLISIIAFTIIDIITKNMIISILGIIITNIVLMIFYDFNKGKKYIDESSKIDRKNILKIFRNGFFTFGIAILGVYVLNAPKYAIDNYLANNYQTIFGIIVMPATVIGLVAQFLIHPYLNQLVKLYDNNDYKNFMKLILKIIILIIVFGCFATVMAFLIGTQVLEIIYGIALDTYKFALSLIIVSATLYTIGTIYSSILITVRVTLPQFIIYLIVSVFACIISNILTKNFEIKGAVLSYFCIMLMQSILYVSYSNFKLKRVFKGK